jgi:hypothetical protein
VSSLSFNLLYFLPILLFLSLAFSSFCHCNCAPYEDCNDLFLSAAKPVDITNTSLILSPKGLSFRSDL